MEKKTLTVFTPVYNRAYSLPLGYEALCRQTSNDFEWLIVDDGSTDNTRELVKQWMDEGKVNIRYIYQDNQGMHGAHNTAYRNIHTELNTCIDSDDYMPDDAVEIIISFWRKYGSDKYAGMMALDADLQGKVIGTPFLDDMKHSTVNGFYARGGKGDKKLIYRTDVICSYPEYPLFEGEKYVSLGYKYELIDQDYELLTLNEIVCMVEYRPDGSSMNMFHQYLRNPRGFAFIRKNSMCLAPTWKRRFIEAAHYVSSSIILRNGNYIKESPRKFLTLLATPLGVAFYGYIMYKNRKYR